MRLLLQLCAGLLVLQLSHGGVRADLHGERRAFGDEVLRELIADIGPVAANSSRARASIHHVVAYMPAADLSALTPGFVASGVALALASPFGDQAPLAAFVNDVVPYASLTEPRDGDWRSRLGAFMRPLVAPCGRNATCAALALNEANAAWAIVDPPIIYAAAEANALNSYSPLQTMRRHNSSCTGLSVFLVDALRSVGIPARVAGTPHWNKGPRQCPRGDASAACGNHNWVELFVDGDWHFVDQRGGLGVLDAGWFFPGDTSTQAHDPASMNHSIYSSSWAPATAVRALDSTGAYSGFAPAAHFPMAWDWANTAVPAWESVDWYKRRRAQVREPQTRSSISL